MRIHLLTASIVLLASASLPGTKGRAAESSFGSWTMTHANTPGQVHFSVERSSAGDHYSHSSSDWNQGDFHGIDWSLSGKHDVRFSIDRDAGQIEGDGFLKDGEGAGLLHFKPNPNYSQQMATLGFAGITADKQFANAMQDVSFAFVREVKAMALRGVDTDKLLALRIFRVDKEFVNSLASAGLPIQDADKLIAFRIHGVTPEFIKVLRSNGYSPDPDKLIAFRIHGVSPEFVASLERLGYKHPDADQLIAMRIHGVTPEYIQKMRAHGMEHLSIEQLVNLRIHGIN